MVLRTRPDTTKEIEILACPVRTSTTPGSRIGWTSLGPGGDLRSHLRKAIRLWAGQLLARTLTLPRGPNRKGCEMGGIVVGVDRSPHAVDALRFALDEARLRGAELTVVEVWQQPYLSEDVGPDTASALDEPARKRAEQLLQDQVGKALDGEQVPEGVHLLVRAGNPVEELIRLGRSADLLVVGARGHGGFRHLLTGSVATQLINHAPCPVMVVPARPMSA
jgi:nucleotide-binding universal stress UspA family protein